jgi:hypothetical protein
MPGIKKNALNCTCSTRYFAQERLAANCFFVDVLQELMINGKHCKKGKIIIPQNLRQVDYGTGAASCNINGKGKLLPISLKRCYTVFPDGILILRQNRIKMRHRSIRNSGSAAGRGPACHDNGSAFFSPNNGLAVFDLWERMNAESPHDPGNRGQPDSTANAGWYGAPEITLRMAAPDGCRGSRDFDQSFMQRTE